jgi:hypothetical protein
MPASCSSCRRGNKSVFWILKWQISAGYGTIPQMPYHVAGTARGAVGSRQEDAPEDECDLRDCVGYLVRDGCGFW